MVGLNFIALDLETATWEKSSICEIGIAIVRDSCVVETKSWLVKPYRNWYDSFNISIHGITPEMTKNSPSFKEVWREVQPYLENQVVVAHNTAFDMYALKYAFEENGMPYPNFRHFCSYRETAILCQSSAMQWEFSLTRIIGQGLTQRLVQKYSSRL